MAEQLSAAELEALDPTPDIHALFAYYNELYFSNKLGACSVEWSTKRMTMCAGICCYSRTSGCRIKLSEPLLKFRPTRDLKETLLHEMIHAELFLDNVRNDGDHGPLFRSRMTAINKATFADYQRPPGGYNITVYHTMHDEVNLYRTHVWSCNRCGNTVKRSMNRPPQEADCRAYTKAVAAAAASNGQAGSYCKDARCWYHAHVKHCGGTYIKVSEPEKPAASNKAAASGSQQQQTSGTTGSNKRSKQPAAVAAAGGSGMHSIESFFRKQGGPQQQQSPKQQQKQQQQQETVTWQEGDLQHVPAESSEQQQGAVPVAQQPWQQDPQHSKQQQQQQHSGQQPHQQQQQQQHTSAGGDYWSAVGKGRMLGASLSGKPTRPMWPGQGQSSAARDVAVATHAAQDQQQPLRDALQRQPSSELPVPRQQEMQQLDDVWQQARHLLHKPNKQQLGRQQQQHDAVQHQKGPGAASTLQEALDVVELLSSDDEACVAPAADSSHSAGKGLGSTGMHHTAANHRSTGRNANVAFGARHGSFESTPGGSQGVVGEALMCPVCCQEWSAGEISNAQLNAHLDGCLARMH